MIVLLDGKCTMCSYFGIWMAWLDRNNVLTFASQQSDKGAEIMQEYKCTDYKLKSIIACNEETKEYYTKSTCVLEMMRACTLWLLPLVLLGYLIPMFIRDAIYEFVSVRRHQWFGTEACAKPPKYYRQKVLDKGG